MESKEFKKFYNLVSPDILEVNEQVALLKEAVLYQIFSPHFNVFVCGHPGAGAKSSMRKSLTKICPSFDYVFLGGYATSKGMAQTIMGVREGLVMLDEINKATGSNRAMLMDVLQFQVLKVDKYGEHMFIKTPVNILALSNPKPHGKWNSYGNIQLMRRQLPTDIAFLRRFHANIFLRDYKPKEFDQVNRFKESIHNPIISDTDTEWFQNEVVQKRMLEPRGGVPERVYNFLKNLKLFEDEIVTPISNELIDGVRNAAMARAIIRNSERIERKDWNGAMMFYRNCLKTSGLSNRLILQKFVKGKY